ncbi:MAG: MotA/TolQ/ExbB proton channel family protein [Odoribacteraceae bacterium]|nr:MotA/TolQ/ExbB proton channel family protein [Odoribacteraceae bacterium]
MNDTFFMIAPPGEFEQGLWGLIVKGGWLMIPIFLLSLVAVYVACERFWAIRKIRVEESAFAREIHGLLVAGKTDEARARCAGQDTLLARVLAKGIARLGGSPGEIRQAMEERANIEIARLGKGTPLLASCAGTAPMIGFLGTVIGMIQAFYDMASAGSNIDIGLLSRGIYTALITTVAGLIVGIIGNLAFNHLVAMIDTRTHWLEGIIEAFAEIPLLSLER